LMKASAASSAAKAKLEKLKILAAVTKLAICATNARRFD
jgi:hypothetical protein